MPVDSGDQKTGGREGGVERDMQRRTPKVGKGAPGSFMGHFIVGFAIALVCGLFVLLPASNGRGFSGNGEPLKYISSCEIDLDNDGRPDIALLVETLLGRELIALFRTDGGYRAFLVWKGKEAMFMSCCFGKTVRESQALPNGGKVYNTPGAYIELHQPESSSVAYFWTGAGFKEVWTSD